MDAQADTQPEQPQAEQAELNDFGRIALQFLKFGQNASNNIQEVFSEMTIQQWLRLVIITGGYLLLRPYVMKYLGKRQVDSMEKQEAEEKAKISPNELRDGKSKPDDEEDEDEGESSAANWGAKARTRQRVMLKQLLEAEERRKQEEEDDKDIEEFLED